MKKIILIFFLTFLLFKETNAEIYNCIKAAKKYEKIYKLPENLLVSISLTESGKKLKNGEFVAWPWTINARGKGKFFSSKQEATKYVSAYVNKGKKNIDLGCMQVNHMYHPNAFLNLEEAFDPDTNVKWSANLIKNLYQKYGSYREAVGYYHSYRPTKKNKYATKVFNTWRNLNKNNLFANLKITSEDRKDLDKVSTNYNKFIDKKQKEVNLNSHRKNNLIKKIKISKNHKVNSAYIIARMEKVRFFRKYFLK